jgi:ABC-type bacteriocin/lantibiotic exporter with double-glycine peptidase domain
LWSNRALKIIATLLILLASNALALEIEGVPFVKQDSQFCGPASLASVMTFHGISEDQKTVGAAVYSEKLQGALITDLERYARQKGFETKSGRGTMEELKAEIDRKRPVIVLVDLGFWVVSKPHYLVVIGYDDEGFTAHDGYTPQNRYSYDRFGAIWGKMGNTYLLLYRVEGRGARDEGGKERK